MLRHDFSENGQGAFDEKGIVVDHSMTGNDENDRRSSRPQMLSRLLRGDELPKDGACLVLAKLGNRPASWGLGLFRAAEFSSGSEQKLSGCWTVVR